MASSSYHRAAEVSPHRQHDPLWLVLVLPLVYRQLTCAQVHIITFGPLADISLAQVSVQFNSDDKTNFPPQKKICTHAICSDVNLNYT